MRVLQIAVGINGGGVGAVLLNYYSHMDHNDVKFDIVIDDLPSVKTAVLMKPLLNRWVAIFFVSHQNQLI